MPLQAEARRHDITGREKACPHNITVAVQMASFPGSESLHISTRRAWLTKLHPQQHENTVCVTAVVSPFSQQFICPAECHCHGSHMNKIHPQSLFFSVITASDSCCNSRMLRHAATYISEVTFFHGYFRVHLHADFLKTEINTVHGKEKIV